jgi:hypothetical protein
MITSLVLATEFVANRPGSRVTSPVHRSLHQVSAPHHGEPGFDMHDMNGRHR